MTTPAPYTKPHLSIPDQAALLASRGLVIYDAARAEQLLSSIGYYRLSGYWYPFREVETGGRRLDSFTPGTTIDQILALYDFDRRLKLHLLDGVERVEIAARVQVGYVLGARDAYAHFDPTCLDPKFTAPASSGGASKYDAWLDRVRDAQRRSKEDFVTHFKNKYDGRLPTWVVTEILDFGGVSVLYSGLKRDDREMIAKYFSALDPSGRGNGAAFANWLRVLNYVRNVSAHHSRLWNRNMDVQIAPKHLGPIGPLSHLNSGHPAQLRRVYGSLSLILFLLDTAADEESTLQWRDTFAALTDTLPLTGRSLLEMGFPRDWSTLGLWR